LVCTRSVLYSFRTGPPSVQYCPLQVALGIPSRGHSIEVHFSCCHANVSPVAMRTNVSLAIIWQGHLFLMLGNMFIEGCSATDRSIWFSRKHV
jgi:hypothetical protein